MASGDGIILGKTSIDLTNGVGIRVSLPLADGVVASIASMGRVGAVHTSIGIAQGNLSAGDDTRVMGLASGVGIRVSLPLANGVVATISSISSIGRVGTV